VKKLPDYSKYPHISRWLRHISSYEDSELPGDSSKPYTSYGPTTLAARPKGEESKAEEDDDDIDLFGSDDEEEDAETVRVREERLAEYRKKKEGKTKPAAKSVVTLDVKPWGMYTVLWQNPS
jgi:elongation factor 1-beta